MKFLLLTLSSLLVLCISCSSNSSHSNARSYEASIGGSPEFVKLSAEQLATQLKHTELAAPLQFVYLSEISLNPSYKMVKNGFLKPKKRVISGYKLTGTLSSEAAKATYKDAVIEISYFSSTKTKIGAQTITAYEFFKPGSRVPFQFSADYPSAAASYNAKLINLSGVY